MTERRLDVHAPACGIVRGVSLTVEEALSTPTRASVRCVSDGPIELAAVIGEPISVTLAWGADRSRHFHGVIVEATQSHSHDDGSIDVELAFAPQLAVLGLGCDSRMFQDRTVVEIVSGVFERARLAEEIVWAVDGTYPPAAYVVQHQESDLSFVERLLGEDGIGYAITHDAAGAQLVLFDDLRQLTPIEGDALTFAVHLEGRERDNVDVVFDVVELHVAASDGAMLRDYDLTAPAKDVSARAEGGAAEGREVYVHPGRTQDEALLAQRAARLVERLRTRARTIEGKSTCRHLSAGKKFDLVGHPRGGIDGTYVVLEVSHREDGDHYENRFVAISENGPYRPERVPPRPLLGGTQVAFVTGAAGAELHGSERGQVKVRFAWDRSGVTDDTSSTWLRVGQPPMPGPMIVPRVGFEVIVDHEMGDLERPFVRGHLYNGEAPVPYALPEHAVRTSLQTATTGGGGGVNEVRFDDTGGAEEIFINASKDMTVSVENNSNVGVVANETMTIGNNHTVSVGATLNEVVTASRTLTIAGNQSLNTASNYADSVGAGLSYTSGSRSFKAGGDYTENVAGSLDRTVGGLQCVTGITGYDRQIVGASTTAVGAAMVAMTAGSLSSTCGAVRAETVGALKLVKAKTVSVSCGAAYVMNAATETVKVGGDNTVSAVGAVAISAGGGMSIKATNINISGESKVVLQIGGSLIEVLPNSVKIKSARIDAKTIKKLGSGPSHGTN